MPAKLTLEPNQPIYVALDSPDGVINWEGNIPVEMSYRLIDGRTLTVPMDTARSILELGLLHHEEFAICRYHSQDRKVKDRINVWLTPAGEKLRAKMEREAAEEEAAKKLERQLEGSLRMAQAPKTPDAPPPLIVPSGPVAMPKPQAAPAEIPAPLGPLYSRLAADTKQLLTVYSEVTKHAESLGIPSGVVRSVMLSAYISLNQRGGRAA